jgi:hypothetical protein
VHTSICLSLDFSTWFLQRDVRDIEYVDSVSLKLSHCVIRVFYSTTDLHPSFSLLGFWRVIHDNCVSTVEGRVLRIKSYYISIYI